MASTAVKKKHAGRKRSSRNEPWVLRKSGGLQILEARPLARINWLLHGFSTRPGGASELPGHDPEAKRAEQVLNLSFTDWDRGERVLQNRRDFFAALKAQDMRVMAIRQIHSDVVQVANSAEFVPGSEAPQADGLITNNAGLLLVVQIADCVPILLADKKRRAIAAIHSGWRGTLQRIAAKALGRMQMEFGTRPQDVVAAMGPGIGLCCFEVGPEVAAEFAAKFPEAREWFKGPFDSLARGDNDPNWLPWLTMRPPGHSLPEARVHLDLIAANRAILSAAGVLPEKIFSSGWCTACRTDLCFSYRRERATGRMMAAIAIRPN